jgi:hypothetical protein
MPLATRPPNKPASVALIADAEAVEIRRPIVTGKQVRLQPLDQRRLQPLLVQVAQGDVVQRIGRLAVMQMGQEANTALVVGAAEPAEGRAADDGDVAVLALVGRAGVVDRDGRTDFQARFEQAGLLGREGLLARRQQGIDLTERDVEAPFAQLLVQLRLRDVAVVVLVQNEGTQARTEMQSTQLRRAGRREYPAVRGRPPFEQEAGVVRPDPQVLHREGAVAEKARPLRPVVDRQRAFFMNVEVGGLRRLARIRTFAMILDAGLVILARVLVRSADLPQLVVQGVPRGPQSVQLLTKRPAPPGRSSKRSCHRLSPGAGASKPRKPLTAYPSSLKRARIAESGSAGRVPSLAEKAHPQLPTAPQAVQKSHPSLRIIVRFPHSPHSLPAVGCAAVLPAGLCKMPICCSGRPDSSRMPSIA